MAEWDLPYEASDEASESELLERSLSVWKGNPYKQDEDFAPIPLDLHTASSIGQYDCVRNIIHRREVNLDRKNKGGWTALMYSCYIGHDNIVNLLLDAGVAVNIKNNKGQTPFILAASCGNESVAYFLLQAGADIEARDKKGWTALFHATYSGHQNMVRFLLDNSADMDTREPSQGFTPFLEAAASGHEIIVQLFLHHGINLYTKAKNGHTARSLALMYGHMKIVSLIDNHIIGPSHSLRSEAGLRGQEELSSSDEAYQHPRNHSLRGSRSRPRGCLIGSSVSTQDGPEAFARLIGGHHGNSASGKAPPTPHAKPKPAPGVTSFSTGDTDAGSTLCQRDVTSPINLRDLKHSPDSSSASRESAEYDEEGSAFSKTGALTIKSSSSSSGGLIGALGISRQSSLEERRSPEPRSYSDPGQHSPPSETRMKSKGSKAKSKVEGHSDAGVRKLAEKSLFDNLQLGSLTPAQDQGLAEQQESKMEESLMSLLSSLGLAKYYHIFQEEDVDLQVFLSLTDNDLKEIGIKLFGPRRKMTNAIARWHSQVRTTRNDLEQAYADRLEAEMQELAIQLHRSCEQVEQLKTQLVQERELRSVTESCVMEDRQAWNEVRRLASDTRQHLAHLYSNLSTIRQEQEVVSRRLEEPCGSSAMSLVAALQQGLSLDAIQQPTHALLRHMTNTVDDCLDHLTMVSLNTDKLLGRDHPTSPCS